MRIGRTVSEEEFEWGIHTSPEGREMGNLAINQVMSFKCRWEHSPKHGVCHGRQMFYYAARKHGWRISTRHAGENILIKRLN